MTALLSARARTDFYVKQTWNRSVGVFLHYVVDTLSAAPQDVDPVEEKLVQLSLLPASWDGRRAPAPTQDAVDIARRLVRAGRDAGFGEIRVAPDVEGGIATYFFGGERLADGGWSRQAGVLTSNNGEATIYLRDQAHAGADIADLETTEEALRGAVHRILKFIRGT